MMRGFCSGRRGGRLVSTASAIVLTAMAPAVQAAEPPIQVAQEAAGGAAEAATLYQISIPAGPVLRGLEEIGRVTGLSVVYLGAPATDAQGPAVSGRMTADDAFRRILRGTGLVHRFTNDRTVAVEAVRTQGALTLDPITVEGAADAGETAYGPVSGYVATRTATATKTDVPILETPQSITVVGAQELEDRNVQSLEDAIKYTPGVQLTYGATGDSRGSWYRMRGFPITTTFYRDGMQVSGQSWQKMDSALMERVEILRGPASVLYGRTVPGGLVNVVSKRPQDTPSAEVAVEYGSFDWKRAEADVTGRLDDSGEWLYRLTTALQDSDGVNGIDHDRQDRKVIAPSLTWQPRDGSSVTVSVVHQKDESRGWWPRSRYTTAAGRSDPSTYLGEPDYDHYDMEQNHVTLLGEHAFDPSLKVSLSARYSTYNLDYQQTWPGLVQPGGTTISRSNYAYGDEADVYTTDARVEKKVSLGGTDHTVLAGFDYLYAARDNYFGSGAEASMDLFNPTYGTYSEVTASEHSNSDQRSAGLYLQDHITIDNWVVQLGGRRDFSGVAGSNGYQDAFTGRVGVAYKTGFGLVPYASYAESFEPQSGFGWGNTRFEPTTGRQYEVGAKYAPPGLDLMATVALFDLRKQNVLTPDPDPTHLCGGSQCKVQTGEVKSQGVELGLTMGLADGLSGVASYTYNPVEVSKSNTPGEVGRQQADTPIHTASVWLDYAIQRGPVAGLDIAGGLRFVSGTRNAAGDVRTSPQFIDEAAVRYEVDDWRLSVNAKNLFDREIEYSCSTSGTNGERCYLHEPLTLTARLAKTF